MKKIVSIAAVLTAFGAFADEGQWQPHQIKKLQHEFDRIGMELSA